MSADKDGISTALKFDIKELQQVLGAKITLKLTPSRARLLIFKLISNAIPSFKISVYPVVSSGIAGKLNTDGLIPSGEQTEEEGPSDDFLADLMNMMTEGEFALDEATGVATLKSELSLFGLDLDPRVLRVCRFRRRSRGLRLKPFRRLEYVR